MSSLSYAASLRLSTELHSEISEIKIKPSINICYLYVEEELMVPLTLQDSWQRFEHEGFIHSTRNTQTYVFKTAPAFSVFLHVIEKLRMSGFP